MMYRVIAIVGSALALAACTSSSSDFMNLDAFKPAPAMDSVQFESDPPGADAKVSNGQTCRTPCALALPTAAPLTVTFTLNGYQPETETLDVIQNTGAPPNLRPNPVSVALTVAPPPAKPAKKPAKKRPAAKKPAAKPKPKTAAKPAARKPAAPAPAPASEPAPAPAPMPAEPPPQQAPSPWPTAPAPQQQ
ncbi:MAG TPA: hypothetical protein VG986_13305 [Pseudolabrys sp.]|nr:hypothetical protein [Pseudolabrys sp.]